MSQKHLIGSLFVGVALIGTSFYGGTAYGKTHAGRTTGNFVRGQGAMQPGVRGGANNQFMGGTTGEVLSKDTTSVTIKLQDGGSRTAYFSDSTAVQKTVPGTLDDVVIGGHVFISGDTNADGSVSAKSIQIRNGEVQPTAPRSES